jgi:sec-independent protein translocase protein TatC
MKNSQEKEMSFLDHLEALRWHLIRATLAILTIAIVLFVYQKEVYEYFLLAHLNNNFPAYAWLCEFSRIFGIESGFCNVNYPLVLQSLSPTDQLSNAMWTSAILGFVIAFPYVLFEIWSFISPGLSVKERKSSRGFIVISSFLFFMGVTFSYFVISPLSVYFFFNYQITDMIQNNFNFSEYISMITNTMLGVAIVFELPIIIYFLTKIGLVTPEFLRSSRKYAIVIILIVAAIITPPDVASQIIVAIPIMILYEVSILISKLVIKKEKENV